jgi:hypothetical protein
MTHDRLRLSIPLLLLDAVGALLAGVGLAKTVAGIDLIPPSWRFAGDGIVLLLLGAMLMLPFNIHLLRQLNARRAGARSRSPQA